MAAACDERASAPLRVAAWLSVLDFVLAPLDTGRLHDQNRRPGRHSSLKTFAASCIGVAFVILPALWIYRIPSSQNTM